MTFTSYGVEVGAACRSAAMKLSYAVAEEAGVVAFQAPDPDPALHLEPHQDPHPEPDSHWVTVPNLETFPHRSGS